MLRWAEGAAVGKIVTPIQRLIADIARIGADRESSIFPVGPVIGEAVQVEDRDIGAGGRCLSAQLLCVESGGREAKQQSGEKSLRHKESDHLRNFLQVVE